MPITKATPKKTKLMKATPKKQPKKKQPKVDLRKQSSFKRTDEEEAAAKQLKVPGSREKLREKLLKKPAISPPKIMQKPASTPEADDVIEAFLRHEAGGDEEVLKHKMKQVLAASKRNAHLYESGGVEADTRNAARGVEAHNVAAGTCS